MGAAVGFALAIVLAHSRLLRRGFLPYIVASQTIPILAIAPMVVVWLAAGPSPPGSAVAVIAAYLTFFPVDDQHAARAPVGRPARARADALVRAGRWTILWKLRSRRRSRTSSRR